MTAGHDAPGASASNLLSRSHIPTPTTIPPEVTAFGPDAVRLWTNGPPAVRRMVEWIVVASDRELVVIVEEMERQLAVLCAPIPNPQNTKGPVKGLAQSTGPSRSHRA